MSIGEICFFIEYFCSVIDYFYFLWPKCYTESTVWSQLSKTGFLLNNMFWSALNPKILVLDVGLYRRMSVLLQTLSWKIGNSRSANLVFWMHKGLTKEFKCIMVYGWCVSLIHFKIFRLHCEINMQNVLELIVSHAIFFGYRIGDLWIEVRH